MSTFPDWKILGRARLYDSMIQISSSAFVKNFAYFTTFENNAKLFRINERNFCTMLCPENGYCDAGICQCIANYTYDFRWNDCVNTVVSPQEPEQLLAPIGIVFVALFAAVVYAQTKPTWPSGFSATVEIRRNFQRRPDFFRWFYDSTKGTDRWDGIIDFKGERFIANIFFLHDIGRQYNVLYQGNEVLCFYHPINETIPKPNFDNYRFAGKALVEYYVADHWFFNDDSKGEFIQYYDRETDQKPLRFDIEVRRNGTQFTNQILYHEFDATTPSALLFEIPAVVKSICNAY